MSKTDFHSLKSFTEVIHLQGRLDILTDKGNETSGNAKEALYEQFCFVCLENFELFEVWL